MFSEILLVANEARHNRRALYLALRLACTYRARLTALCIIDSGWQDMLGGEWISTGRARREFYNYFEGGIREQSGADLQAVTAAAGEYSLEVDTGIKEGKPEKVITRTCAGLKAPALVIISLASGLRLKTEKITRTCGCPVLTVPGD